MFRKTLSDYLVDGEYWNESESSFKDATSLLMSMLGFCGCGVPVDSLRYILRGLELIGEDCPEMDAGRDVWKTWQKGHFERREKHFGSYGAEYFFYYWCDKEGLTDHGGSVPGWLTPDGENLLSLLRDWAAQQETC